MSKRWADQIPFKMIVTVLAIVFGISLGLCGVTAIVSTDGNTFGVGLGVLELIVMGVSLAGLVLTLVVVVTLWIFGAFGEKVSQSENFPKEGDDTRSDKNE